MTRSAISLFDLDLSAGLSFCADAPIVDCAGSTRTCPTRPASNPAGFPLPAARRMMMSLAQPSTRPALTGGAFVLPWRGLGSTGSDVISDAELLHRRLRAFGEPPIAAASAAQAADRKPVDKPASPRQPGDVVPDLARVEGEAGRHASLPVGRRYFVQSVMPPDDRRCAGR